MAILIIIIIIQYINSLFRFCPIQLRLSGYTIFLDSMHPISKDSLASAFYDEAICCFLRFLAGKDECVERINPAWDLGGNAAEVYSLWVKFRVTWSLVASMVFKTSGFFFFGLRGFIYSSGILLVMYLKREVGISDSSSCKELLC